MRSLFVIVFLFIYSFIGISQIIEDPNFAMASHPMKVTKIEYLKLGH